MQCWFCEKNASEGNYDISLKFERFNYKDRFLKTKQDRPTRIKKELTIPRCNACFDAHKRYNRISLFAVIPATVMAASLYLLFAKAGEGFVFGGLALGIFGFGVVAFLRRNYLKRYGIKALVEMEMQNDDIKAALANGWYRQ